jgi:hypothetical protein
LAAPETGGELVKKCLYVISAVLIFTTIAGCRDETGKTVEAPPTTQPMTVQPTPALQKGPHAASGQHTGKVVEFINTGTYTYVHVDTGDNKIWAAAPTFQVKEGDKVIIPPGMTMKNFQSKTLNRTFDLVYFVPRITTAGAKPASSQLPQGHPKPIKGGASALALTNVDFSGIEKPEGGKTVAEIYNEKATLSGKEVVVRGKVVKYNAGIMGKNWLHLKDGTGTEGTNDLTVTTNTQTKVGDTVLARGLVVTDKDYGHGYAYPVIIEDAKVTVE